MALPNALTANLQSVTQEFRVAPHNIDAEQALLGAILVNNDAYYRISDFSCPSISWRMSTARSSRSPPR